MHNFQTVEDRDTINPTEIKKEWGWGDGRTGKIKQVIQNKIV